MTTWTINSRSGMTGSVTTGVSSLTWNITAPPSAVGNFSYGSQDMIPLVGDWNGDSTEGIGTYHPSDGSFHLRQTPTAGNADIIIGLGAPNLTPLSWHDESGSLGHDAVGIIDGSGNIYLDSNLANETTDINAAPSDISCPPSNTVRQCAYTPPAIISWTINSRSGMAGSVTKGVSSLTWNITAPPSAVGNFTYGSQNMIPLVGDWNGDGTEGIGVYDPSNGAFHLRQTPTAGSDNIMIGLGAPNLTPLSWHDESGSLGHDAVGIIDGSGNIYLDSNLANETTDINATPSDISCPPSNTVRQCAYTPTPRLATIVITPTTASIQIGATQQLDVVCTDQYDASFTCPTLTWSSTSSSVATVNSSGLVTGVAAGSTSITASDGGLITSDVSLIIVEAAPAEAGGIGMIAIAGIGIVALMSMQKPVTK